MGCCESLQVTAAVVAPTMRGVVPTVEGPITDDSDVDLDDDDGHSLVNEDDMVLLRFHALYLSRVRHPFINSFSSISVNGACRKCV